MALTWQQILSGRQTPGIDAVRRPWISSTPSLIGFFPNIMTPTQTDDITRLLLAWRSGDEQALDQLTQLVYDELRRLAARYLRRERAEHTLQPTALVVDFREIYSLPFELLTLQAEAAEKRWRLKSPYLEHFSQAFARFFMRVGLPSAIPPFK